MKMITTLFLMCFILAGCVSSIDPATVPNSPATERDNAYLELKAEFYRAIEHAKKGSSGEYIDPEVTTHLDEGRKYFEEMLQYRQSLDDFSQTTEIVYSEKHGSKVLIAAEPIFVAGDTNYRLIMFSADNLSAVRVYLQFFNENSLKSQCIYVYYIDPNDSEIIYSDFQQDAENLYLTIIQKERNYDTSADNYYLVNYKIDEAEITNYSALKKAISQDGWTIDEVSIVDDSIPLQVSVTKIAYELAEPELFDPNIGSKASFQKNKLTIALNIEAKNEISLLFKDGFWETTN